MAQPGLWSNSFAAWPHGSGCVITHSKYRHGSGIPQSPRAALV
jgi:hypothetical protein